MLFGRFTDASGNSLNGVQPNILPMVGDTNGLIPFQVPKSKLLKLDMIPAFGVRFFFAGGSSTFTLKVNNNLVTDSDVDGASTMTVASGVVTGTNPGGGFISPGKKQVGAGTTYEISNITTLNASGVSVLLYPRFYNDTTGAIRLTIQPSTINLAYQTGVSTWTDIGANTALTTNSSSVLKIVFTDTEIQFWHGTNNFKTVALTYKVRLLNEAGTDVDTNAGTITNLDGSAYAGALIPTGTDLNYTTGSVLGTYNVEIENQHGIKVLQKIVVSDAAGGGSVIPISNNLINNANLNNNTSVGWWSTYKTGIVVGAVVVLASILGILALKKLFS